MKHNVVRELSAIFERIAALEEKRREVAEEIAATWKEAKELGLDMKVVRELYRRRYKVPLAVAEEVRQLELALDKGGES